MNKLYTRSNVRMLEQVVIKPVIVGKGLIMCYNQFMSITNLDLMLQEEFIFQLDPNSIPTEYLICQCTCKKFHVINSAKRLIYPSYVQEYLHQTKISISCRKRR